MVIGEYEFDCSWAYFFFFFVIISLADSRMLQFISVYNMLIVLTIYIPTWREAERCPFRAATLG